MAEGEKSPELLAAELEKARADAEAAREAARKTAAEADKLEQDLTKQREEHTEWQAAAEDRTSQAEALAEEKRLANEEKALTNDKQRLDNVQSQRSWITDAVPDLSGADRGELTGGDKPLFANLLATRALNDAAKRAAINAFAPGVTIAGKVLLTTDEKLVDRLAIHDGVMSQIRVLLTQVNAAKSNVPRAPAEQPPTEEAGGGAEAAGVVVAGAAAALSKVVPGLISLISAHRALASADVTQDAYLTMLAIAGQIRSWPTPPPVLIDQTRVLRGDTEVERQFEELRISCNDLSVSIASGADRTDEKFVTWSKGAQATLALAQAAMQALTTVAGGATISPLMGAAAQAIYADRGVSHIIVVRNAGASTSQVTDDMPIAMKDRVHIVTTASIGYVSIDPATSEVIRAGVEVGYSSYAGTIGSRFEFDSADSGYPGG